MVVVINSFVEFLYFSKTILSLTDGAWLKSCGRLANDSCNTTSTFLSSISSEKRTKLHRARGLFLRNGSGPNTVHPILQRAANGSSALKGFLILSKLIILASLIPMIRCKQES